MTSRSSILCVAECRVDGALWLNACFCVDDTGYCTPAEELQADWPKPMENLRLDDDQEFPAVTRMYT